MSPSASENVLTSSWRTGLVWGGGRVHDREGHVKEAGELARRCDLPVPVASRRMLVACLTFGAHVVDLATATDQGARLDLATSPVFKLIRAASAAASSRRGPLQPPQMQLNALVADSAGPR